MGTAPRCLRAAEAERERGERFELGVPDKFSEGFWTEEEVRGVAEGVADPAVHEPVCGDFRA